MKPKFSIIIPTYNRAHTLMRAVRGVLSQSYPNWELIIIDDGSTDSTKEVIEGVQDSRVRYYHQENKMVAAARNHGIRVATGEYICFLDSDDEIFADYLSVFEERLRRESHEMLVADTIIRSADRDSIERIRLMNGGDFLIGDMPSIQSVCTRSDILGENPFDETLYMHEDAELWSRISPAVTIHRIAKITSRVNVAGTDRLSQTSFRKRRELYKTYDLIVNDPKRPSYPRDALKRKLVPLYRSLSLDYLERGNFDMAIKHYIETISLSPDQLFKRWSLALVKRYVWHQIGTATQHAKVG